MHIALSKRRSISQLRCLVRFYTDRAFLRGRSDAAVLAAVTAAS